jgi:hypothetical protein
MTRQSMPGACFISKSLASRALVVIVLIVCLLVPSPLLLLRSLKLLARMQPDLLRASKWSRQTVRLNNLNVLIYVTIHLSKQHVLYLQSCWPRLFAKSRLFRQADVAVFLTHDEPRQ